MHITTIDTEAARELDINPNLIRFIQSHGVDVTIVNGKLRLGLPATHRDANGTVASCTVLDTIDATYSAARAALGY